MQDKPRLVIDTNVLVSGVLLPRSVPGRMLRQAVDEAQLLVSDETLDELVEVLARARFDPYLAIAERQDFVHQLTRIVERVPVTPPVRACRDPRDDKFLALALGGEAVAIVTGDRDLLALNPFRGIPVLTPEAWLRRKEG